MARIIKTKELINTKLAANYGGWIYCNQCNENIGYLCYSTYDSVDFRYKCNCGCEGSIYIDFDDSRQGENCGGEMTVIKNRFCCSADNEPLITVLEKKLADYKINITCKTCGNIYNKTKEA